MKNLLILTSLFLLLFSCSSTGVSQRNPATLEFSDCFQIVKGFFSSESNKLGYGAIKKRYVEHYSQIYEGIDLSKVRELKINYGKIDGGLGETDLLSHSVFLDENLKKHPASFIFQIHETQHYYDLKIGKIKCIESCDSVKVSNLEIVDSEIRAHLRHFQAAKILFSDEELKELIKLETDSRIKNFLKELVDYGGSSSNYIGMILSEGSYLKFVKKAAQESDRKDYRFFLIERIEQIIDDSIVNDYVHGTN